MENISIQPKIDESWKKILSSEFQKEYFIQLKKFLLEEKANHIIYPPGNMIFAAYNYTPFDKVKVVILGQDPYHNPGEANGLCFSVNDGVKIPPSLLNIFKELKDDIGCEIPKSGNLEKWAIQGVFLLNTSLTVRKNQPGSHRNIGWEKFTDATIKAISDNKANVVFMLWGRWAMGKMDLIDKTKHYILTASHPSPLARTGFLGCRHFSKCNEYLIKHNIEPIDWCL
ncbi:MAG TPA: uracil-DNA glycosylase [Bacteroidia bacterium]|nr:uracil-DNA glycosylase [Bacteroidia bacterium]